MRVPAWGGRPWGAVPPEALVDPTLELHWAAQLVASAGQTFVRPRPDDSHRAMSWDARERALVGEPFAGTYPFRVAVRPEDLTLVLLERTDEALGSLPLAGVTLEEAYEWLAVGLATYMGALPTLERPEYEVPHHPVGAGGRFSGGHEAERAALSGLFGGAAALLAELTSTRDDASPIRCWPHHFDIATLITLAEDAGTTVRTVGAGLAPMGRGYDHWYWYVAPWPYPPPERLPPLTGPGAWHTAGWTGAVLTGDELASRDEAFREAAVRKFLDVSIEAAVASLTS